ncbi:MAG: hypothetical protein HZA51_09370 [Planctomycetes bacterium]|nr:hypothetical protein [Planctomycetota bacterium]
MVAFNITDLPPLSDPGKEILLESIRESHAEIIRAKLDTALNDATTKIRDWLSGFRDAAAKHEAIYAAQEDRISGQVLGEWTDEQLLDRIHQFGLVAEAIRNWCEIIDQNRDRLIAWKADTRIWSDEAESLVASLDHLSRVFNWNCEALYRWMDQLCDEYVRRNPDLPPLPSAPYDLGPTNVARLPQVL